MSEQDDGQAATLRHPTVDKRGNWIVYWKQQGQPWRTEPEIDAERQKYLAECRSILPDIGQHIYPFKDIKLDRADVEWQLAKHHQLPKEDDWWMYKRWQPRPHLNLQGADLRRVDLSGLPLESADFREARLEGAIIAEANLNLAVFCDAHLERATFREASLQGANFSGAHLERTSLECANLDGAMLGLAYLEEAYLYNSSLNRANLVKANLKQANLDGAHLEAAYLYDVHLEGASLSNAHLERANLGGAHLGGCNLRGAFFSSATNLDNATLTDTRHGCALLNKVRWGEVDISGIDWNQANVLGDEQEAHKVVAKDGKTKVSATRIAEYQIAMRTNRQLSIVLREQGLNEEAARFAYRGQLMQRKTFWHQHKSGRYLFSLFLDLLAGYGYKFKRSFIAYLIVIAIFAIAYFIIGQTSGPVLSPVGSVVFSMTSFHGRGFFPGGIGLDDPLTVVAAFEAFIGLLIEVTFIATLTQRLFGK
ncbi:MAG TPA: pentapeptide repeat-containing protein [Ktedonobacteraceae bacterium]|nr:pentapeptide repeat-containing protein [Ktedonobacteraceae bacterium]